MRILLAFLLIGSVLTGCHPDCPHTILPPDCRLMPGDVVFRMGNGMTSRAVLAADMAGDYSHVGIVVDSAGLPMVVHAVPDEPDFEGDADRVKMEPAEQFFISLRAQRGEVCRFQGDTALARKAAEEARRIYLQGVLFDHDYDDDDSTRMYCCELVERAYGRVGISLSEGRRHDLHLPGVGRYHCMLPLDLWKSSQLKTVSAF